MRNVEFGCGVGGNKNMGWVRIKKKLVGGLVAWIHPVEWSKLI
jgi:hypothetical protein